MIHFSLRDLRHIVAVLVTLATLVLRSASASADDKTCDGPQECCPVATADATASRQTVSIGIVISGLSNINERSGTWDADYYLFESWTPGTGFSPQTEIVNEVSRSSEQSNGTLLRAGRCIRSRRIRSTLHNEYNLRTFPFDRQKLTIQFSDARYDAETVTYAPTASVAGLDEPARRQLSAWATDGEVTYTRGPRGFAWAGALRYDYATFEMKIRRHVTYHLAKFFLPLFVIVAIAFAVFWIDPGDLDPTTNLSVTCILAAIAFQLAQAGDLPAVSYLTLADRVYVVCYCAMAAALFAKIYSNYVARSGRHERALQIDQRCRRWFPAALVLGNAIAVLEAV